MGIGSFQPILSIEAVWLFARLSRMRLEFPLRKKRTEASRFLNAGTPSSALDIDKNVLSRSASFWS
jgi:hypothetical protein